MSNIFSDFASTWHSIGIAWQSLVVVELILCAVGVALIVARAVLT